VLAPATITCASWDVKKNSQPNSKLTRAVTTPDTKQPKYNYGKLSSIFGLKAGKVKPRTSLLDAGVNMVTLQIKHTITNSW
jgi:hypothetical protein